MAVEYGFQGTQLGILQWLDDRTEVIVLRNIAPHVVEYESLDGKTRLYTGLNVLRRIEARPSQEDIRTALTAGYMTVDRVRIRRYIADLKASPMERGDCLALVIADAIGESTN